MPDAVYGLVGGSLSHSHSPMVHSYFGDYPYRIFEVKPGELAGIMRSENIAGLNITIPYKKDAARLCDDLSETAAQTGSVNTVVRRGNRLIGHNTDCEGFIQMARAAGIGFEGRKALVLGTGGTAQTAVWCLKKCGASDIAVISRSGKDNYQNISRHYDAEIIVNTTPVGMYPDNGGQLIDLGCFTRVAGVIDAIYNPLRTRLIMQAVKMGLPHTGGLAMLVYQAAYAARLFGAAADAVDKMHTVLAKVETRLNDIALIGMPGSGKTCVGRALAAMLGRRFIDTDEEIAAKTGMSAATIIAHRGEAEFRAIERRTICGLAAHSGEGRVIATGGGAALNPENVYALKQNGRLAHIARPIGMLATGGRPLSADIAGMAKTRMPIYESACDAVFINNASIAQCAAAIAKAWGGCV